MNREKIKSLLIKIIIIFSIILTGQFVFKIFIVPTIVLKKITVDSEVSLTDDEILSIAGIEAGEYFYTIDVMEIKKRLEDYPEVRRASVEKVFPDKLTIYLYERDAVALSVIKIKEKSFPVVIDNNGIVFNSNRDIESWDLPVLTGIRFPFIELGMQLPEPLKPLMEDLYDLKINDPLLFLLISEMKIERRGEKGFDLVLFLNSYPIRARTGKKLDGNVLKTIKMVFDALKQQNLVKEIGEVDFRTKEIVYRLREEV
ncbi:MAG: FtsQ-type POTRA domain-containing protein [Deltaproteobacteria bacterium]|nr:FtsQ-type POTRA domain-containing protein [Deltaproteobacteria bacterium]